MIKMVSNMIDFNGDWLSMGFKKKAPNTSLYFIGFQRKLVNASTLHVDFFKDGEGVNIYLSEEVGNEGIYLDDKIINAIVRTNKVLKANWERRLKEIAGGKL